MAALETAHHHGSHRPLIWPVDESTTPVKVDAIIVPTARRVAHLKESAAAALRGGQAGTTYGKLVARASLETDGVSPEGTAVSRTRDSMASGALSAMVRPLRLANP
jgi:hypothetical protein